MRIRSITLFAQTTVPLDTAAIASMGQTARALAAAYTKARGYEVQTIRFATSFLDALPRHAPAEAIVDLTTELEEACQAAGFDFVSIGPANVELQPLIPELLRSTRSVFVTSPIVRPDGTTIDGEAIRGAAQVIRDAAAIDDGFGNLRFAATANVKPGTPFFPAAFWTAPRPAFAVATESADLAEEACRAAADAAAAHETLRAAITHHGNRLDAIGAAASHDNGMDYLGVDFSLAPYPGTGVSIGCALEALTGQPVGSPGTLAAAATLTDAIQQASFSHTGFCGLMLPVLEDSVLAQRAAEGRLHITELLQWSAVCGTGLDTVPLPGSASVDELAALLFDVAALSVRLHKPLTARLMPLPGKVAGDPVHFDFAYFADGGVLRLEGGEASGPLHRTTEHALHAIAR